jgi:hypothetical protein
MRLERQASGPPPAELRQFALSAGFFCAITCRIGKKEMLRVR